MRRGEEGPRPTKIGFVLFGGEIEGEKRLGLTTRYHRISEKGASYKKKASGLVRNDFSRV